jgi:hypothetical protein
MADYVKTAAHITLIAIFLITIRLFFDLFGYGGAGHPLRGQI